MKILLNYGKQKLSIFFSTKYTINIIDTKKMLHKWSPLWEKKIKNDDLGEGLRIVREDVDDGEIGIGNPISQRAPAVRRKD